MTDFSTALHNMRAGLLVKRSGWDGKSLYVKLIQKVYVDGVVLQGVFVIVNTLTGAVNTWVPLSSDLMAFDWEVVYL